MKSTVLQNTFRFIVLTISMITLLSSCAKDGDVGPKGDPGEAGPAGDKGQTGSLFHKYGFITGTITGVGKDGVTPIQESFRYEFSSSNTPYIFNANAAEYNFHITRLDSVGISNASLRFSTPADFSSARFSSSYINYYKKVDDAQYKELTGELYLTRFPDTSPGAITNLNYDAATGLLTGNYSWRSENRNVDDGVNRYSSYSSTKKPFTVTGSFSFTVRKGSY